MPFLPNPYVLLALGIAFLAAITGSFFEGMHYKDLQWKATIAAQQKQADKEVADAAVLANEVSLKNANLNTTLEKDHADADALIAQKDQRLKSLTVQLSSALGALRVRANGGRSGNNGGQNTASGNPGNSALGSGDGPSDDLLSGSALASIQQIATDADRLANSYRECKAWALNVKQTMTDYNQRVFGTPAAAK